MSFVDNQAAIDQLNRNGVVALPTETVYGLAARIDREESLRKIFSVKERPFFDPLIVHVLNAEQARALTSAWPSEIYDALIEAFWPGPLTLIAPKNPDKVSNLITSGLNTVALRSPDHPVFREILKQVDVPLAAPSANRFGRTSPTTAAHVEREFSGQIAVVDGGPCQVGLESTIIYAHQDPSTNGGGNWQIEVLRPGQITPAQIESVLHKKGLSARVLATHAQPHANSHRDPVAPARAPGTLAAHYQPARPLVLIHDNDNDNDNEIDPAQLPQQIAESLGLEGHLNLVELNLPQEATLAARTLYAQLHSLSEQKDAVIVFQINRHRRSEEWNAIMDRLRRAAMAEIGRPQSL